MITCQGGEMVDTMGLKPIRATCASSILAPGTNPSWLAQGGVWYQCEEHGTAGCAHVSAA